MFLIVQSVCDWTCRDNHWWYDGPHSSQQPPRASFQPGPIPTQAPFQPTGSIPTYRPHSNPPPLQAPLYPKIGPLEICCLRALCPSMAPANGPPGPYREDHPCVCCGWTKDRSCLNCIARSMGEPNWIFCDSVGHTLICSAASIEKWECEPIWLNITTECTDNIYS